MALSTLPQEVTQIGVTTTKESTNVVMFLSLTSDSPQYDALFLSNYAALNITNELGRVKGVGNVACSAWANTVCVSGWIRIS